MTGELDCAEYGRDAPPGAPGWKAEIGDDPRDEAPPELVTYCPACWGRPALLVFLLWTLVTYAT